MSSVLVDSVRRIWLDSSVLIEGMKKDVKNKLESLDNIEDNYSKIQIQQIKTLNAEDQAFINKYAPSDEKDDILNLIIFKNYMSDKNIPKYWDALTQLEVQKQLSNYIKDSINQTNSENRAKTIEELRKNINILTNECECLQKFCFNYKEIKDREVAKYNNDALNKEQKEILKYVQMMEEDKYIEHDTKTAFKIIKIILVGGASIAVFNNLHSFGPAIGQFADSFALYMQPILDTAKSVPILEQISNMLPYKDTLQTLMTTGGVLGAIKAVSFKSIYQLGTKINNDFFELILHNGRPTSRFDQNTTNLKETTLNTSWALFSSFRNMKSGYMNETQENNFLKCLSHCHNLISYDLIKANADIESNFFGNLDVSPEARLKEIKQPTGIPDNIKEKILKITQNEALLSSRIKEPFLQYLYFFETNNFEDKIKILEASTLFSSLKLKPEEFKLEKLNPKDISKITFEFNEIIKKNSHIFLEKSMSNDEVKTKVFDIIKNMSPIEKTLLSYIPNNLKTNALLKYMEQVETNKSGPLSLLTSLQDVCEKTHKNELEKGIIQKGIDLSFNKGIEYITELSGTLKSFIGDILTSGLDVAKNILFFNKNKGYDFDKALEKINKDIDSPLLWENNKNWLEQKEQATRNFKKFNNFTNKIQQQRDNTTENEINRRLNI